MKKFVALFSIPAAAIDEWMSSVDEATRKEQSDAMMSAWETWTKDHADHIVDRGLPLGKTKHVSKDGIADVRNDLNYMMIIQAEDADAAATLIQSNPHLQMIPASFVEIMGTEGPTQS